MSQPPAFYYRHWSKTQAGNLARTHGMWAIEHAAEMQLCPDLANLPDLRIDKKRTSMTKPYWLLRIVWDCQAAARRRAYQAAHMYDDGPFYDAAYLESYAEWFPKLLAEVLATRESQPWD